MSVEKKRPSKFMEFLSIVCAFVIAVLAFVWLYGGDAEASEIKHTFTKLSTLDERDARAFSRACKSRKGILSVRFQMDNKPGQVYRLTCKVKQRKTALSP